MKTKTITKLVIAAFAASAFVPVASMAQDAASQGYLTDSRGVVVTTPSNLCWRHRDPDVPSVSDQCDPAPAVVAATPAPRAVVVAPAPAPQPVILAAAPPVAPRAVVIAAVPVPQKISFSGDALFAFDKAELKPEGKTMLDGLVQQLNGADYESITTTGHTDRFGTTGYNQKLSERRAQTVKDYLVSKNVRAGRIDAAGKGEMQPVTRLSDCKGAKSAKVVACLQPDRRVDIEMKGTRTTSGS